MRNFNASLNPPAWWDEECKKHNNLFQSEEWQNIITSSFNAKTLYIWDNEQRDGATVTIFKAGPFRVGYIGFPVGGSIRKNSINNELVKFLTDTKLPITLHLVQITNTAFSENKYLPIPYSEIPETAISDLQNWDILLQRKTLRSDIKKALSYKINIFNAHSPRHGNAMHKLYLETLVRRSGNLRYNNKYFQNIVNLSITNNRLVCLLAEINGDIAGFLTLAFHGKTAFYLHGGHSISCRQYKISDLLLHRAIILAKKAGITKFNFMASPKDQPSLIFYKEKWGGVTKNQKVYYLARNKIFSTAYFGARTMYDFIKRYVKS